MNMIDFEQKFRNLRQETTPQNYFFELFKDVGLTQFIFKNSCHDILKIEKPNKLEDQRTWSKNSLKEIDQKKLEDSIPSKEAQMNQAESSKSESEASDQAFKNLLSSLKESVTSNPDDFQGNSFSLLASKENAPFFEMKNLILKKEEFEGRGKLLIVTKKFFDQNARDLLYKMMSAIDLKESDYELFEFIEEEKSSDALKDQIASKIIDLKVRYVLTLGGPSTILLTEREIRLQMARGHFFKRTILLGQDESLEFYVMPVFHPDFLIINPKMKRLAWEDLKKLKNNLENLSVI